MLGKLVRMVVGSRNDRIVNKKKKIVKRINALEPEMKALSDEALSAKTQEFRDRLAAGETLDSLLPEAFATVRELGRRWRAKEFTSVELTEFFLRRLETLGPKYNAYATLTREHALRLSTQCEVKLKVTGDK